MANAQAPQPSVFQQLEDITECSVCSEHFTDPRSLPCIHTFCLKCLESYSKDKQPGNPIPCPVCRKEFTIPDDGVSALPKNFFLVKMLNITSMSKCQNQDSFCELCDIEHKRTATTYCIETQEKLCDGCADVLQKHKMFSVYKFVKIAADELAKNQETLLKSTANCCEMHDEKLTVYCNDCKTVICVVCYIDSHKQHNCSDLMKVVDSLRQEIVKDTDSATIAVGKLEHMSLSVGKQKDNFARKIRKAQDEVINKAEELKRLIECHKQTLLDELETTKRDTMKQLENLDQELNQQLSLMDSVKRYCEELSSKGSACDIARDHNVLHKRFEELLRTVHYLEASHDDVDLVEIELNASNLLTHCSDNVVGRIDVYCIEDCIPKSRQTITL